jgi:hypothetical protein
MDTAMDSLPPAAPDSSAQERSAEARLHGLIDGDNAALQLD